MVFCGRGQLGDAFARTKQETAASETCGLTLCAVDEHLERRPVCSTPQRAQRRKCQEQHPSISLLLLFRRFSEGSEGGATCQKTSSSIPAVGELIAHATNRPAPLQYQLNASQAVK